LCTILHQWELWKEGFKKETQDRIAVLEKNDRTETTLYRLYKEVLGGDV